MAGGRIILPATDPVLTSANLLNVGATLTIFNTGTTTLANIYAEIGLINPLMNPQTSDMAGRFYDQSTQICADTGSAYDCVLALTDGETFTYTQVYPLGAPTTVTGYAPINSPAFTGTPTAPTPAFNDASANIATTQFVSTALNDLVIYQSGMIMAFAQAAAGLPTGWLNCNGAAVSRSTYAALFTAIGTTYGAGNGTTTFNIPNFQGYFLRGVNVTGSGPDPSRAIATTQTDAMQGHYHAPLGPGSAFESVDHPGNATANATIGGGNNDIMASTGSPITDGANGAPRTAIETRPSNVAICYAIHT